MLIRPKDNCWKFGSLCRELFQFLWNWFKTQPDLWRCFWLGRLGFCLLQSQRIWVTVTCGDTYGNWNLDSSRRWELIPARGDFKLTSIVWSSCKWGCINSKKISCLSPSLILCVDSRLLKKSQRSFLTFYWQYISQVFSVVCSTTNKSSDPWHMLDTALGSCMWWWIRPTRYLLSGAYTGKKKLIYTMDKYINTCIHVQDNIIILTSIKVKLMQIVPSTQRLGAWK
jgi:hypothetical protein